MLEKQIEYQQKRQEVIAKFSAKFTPEYINTNPIIYKVMECLSRDYNPYQLIEELLEMNIAAIEEMRKWVNSTPLPMPLPSYMKGTTEDGKMPIVWNMPKGKRDMHQLTDAQYIEMATIIDTRFANGTRTIVERDRHGFKRVYTHTQGGQCIMADVKFEVKGGILGMVLTQDEDEDAPEPYHHVMPETLQRIREYLEAKGYAY